MQLSLCQCDGCGQMVHPLRSQDGQLVCPNCAAEIKAQIQKTPSIATHTSPFAKRAHGPMIRPANPAEALSGFSSSGSWRPEPDPGPSSSGIRTQVDSGQSDGRRRLVDLAAQLQPADAAAKKGQWLTSPWLWVTVGAITVALAAAVVVMQRQNATVVTAPPVQQPATAAAPATVTVPPAPRPVPAPAPRVVNLMLYMDPARHTQGGHWRTTPQGLVSDNSRYAKLAIPYQPPEEYDFRVEFTRQGGDDCMVQVFTHHNPCAWMVSGWKGTVCGFHRINNKNANNNATSVSGIAIHNGERHTSLLKVRKELLEAYLDGNLIASYRTDGSDLSSSREWEIRNQPLGIGTYVSPTVFHTVQLVEISGSGHPVVSK